MLAFAADVEPTTRQARLVAQLRRWLPWVIGIAIMTAVVTRIPVDSFRAAVGRGHYVALAIVDLVLTAITLLTDALATWVGLIVLRVRRPLPAVIAVRGATYLLFLLNYALGQGGFGYYLRRSGTTTAVAVGASLFLIGTNLAMLVVVTAAAWLMPGFAAPNATMGWSLAIGCSGLALYLLLIAIAPGALARRAVLAPLFETGVRGHLAAMASRLPHTAMMILGVWLAMRAWGIPVPFGVGMAIIPAVVIAAVIPISPGGLGTTQAAMIYFFQAYAAGATADDRAANVLAFSIVHFVYAMVASILVGLACAPSAKRIAAAPPVGPTAP